MSCLSSIIICINCGLQTVNTPGMSVLSVSNQDRLSDREDFHQSVRKRTTLERRERKRENRKESQ